MWRPPTFVGYCQVVSFVLLGDQNAGKSTFLHAFTHHTDDNFLQLSSLVPVLSAGFINTRFLDKVSPIPSFSLCLFVPLSLCPCPSVSLRLLTPGGRRMTELRGMSFRLLTPTLPEHHSCSPLKTLHFLSLSTSEATLVHSCVRCVKGS